MQMIPPAIVEVKPVALAEAFPLAFRTELDLIEDDAREMGEAEYAEPSDAEWDAMAEEAAPRGLADEGRFWM